MSEGRGVRRKFNISTKSFTDDSGCGIDVRLTWLAEELDVSPEQQKEIRDEMVEAFGLHIDMLFWEARWGASRN